MAFTSGAFCYSFKNMHTFCHYCNRVLLNNSLSLTVSSCCWLLIICRLYADEEAAATAAVLLAYGADTNAVDSSGKTPLGITPGAPNCEEGSADLKYCPKTCRLLKSGITPKQKQEIFAGKIPDFGQRAPPAWAPATTFAGDPPQVCCPNEEFPTGRSRFSQCCVQ